MCGERGIRTLDDVAAIRALQARAFDHSAISPRSRCVVYQFLLDSYRLILYSWAMVYLGADHGGFALKEKIKQWLDEWGVEYKDLGAHELDPGDDYPDYAIRVAKHVAQDPDNRGILLCRSGGGMVIAANKIKGARAVEVFNERSAQHAREHNDANIMTLSGDWIEDEHASRALQVFLETEFSGEERHKRRLHKIQEIE